MTTATLEPATHHRARAMTTATLEPAAHHRAGTMTATTLEPAAHHRAWTARALELTLRAVTHRGRSAATLTTLVARSGVTAGPAAFISPPIGPRTIGPVSHSVFHSVSHSVSHGGRPAALRPLTTLVARAAIVADAGLAIGPTVIALRVAAIGPAVHRRVGPIIAHRTLRLRLPVTRRRGRIVALARLRVARARAADDRDQTHAHESVD